MFDETCSPGSALPAGRRAPSRAEIQELWAATADGETDWFAEYDPRLVSDEDIVEMIADKLAGPEDDKLAGPEDDQSATSSTSNPSSSSKYVA